MDDDESDNNNAVSGNLSVSDAFYRKLLKDRSLQFDTVVVPRYSDGPNLEKLKSYSTILWYTGASYGGNRDNTSVISLKDELTLASYVRDTGGTVLLFSPGYLNNALGAGGAALWANKDLPFLRDVIGVKGGRGLLQRFKEGSVVSKSGETFALTKSSSVEIQFSALNPAQAQTLFTAVLDPDGAGPRPVAVATSQTVGAGRFVYVGFTFENIAADADAAFGLLMSSTKGLVTGGKVVSTPAGAFSTTANSGPAPTKNAADVGRPAMAPPFVPKQVNISLEFDGLGRVTVEPAFVPKQVNTSLEFDGLGRVTVEPAFVPKQVTISLEFDGTGQPPTRINTKSAARPASASGVPPPPPVTP